MRESLCDGRRDSFVHCILLSWLSSLDMAEMIRPDKHLRFEDGTAPTRAARDLVHASYKATTPNQLIFIEAFQSHDVQVRDQGKNPTYGLRSIYQLG
jgi:hypothetical protein